MMAALKRTHRGRPTARSSLTKDMPTTTLIFTLVSAKGDAAPIRVTRDLANDYAPTWAPNGRSIVFVSYRNKKTTPDLFFYNLDEPGREKAVVQLTDLTLGVDEPVWSKDGRMILFADADSPLNLVYTILVGPGIARPIEAAQGHRPVWTPDGTGIATAFNQNDREFVAACRARRVGKFCACCCAGGWTH